MRKRFILLLIATLALMSVNARQISEQEAQLKAEKFFSKQGQNHSNMRRVPRKAPKLILASNREELYIFNDEANGGYVVISGDDRMHDVLAYSYDGLYDDNDVPDNMKAWMNDYAAQVAYLKTHPEAKVKRQTATERNNINPLLTCWFAQGAPYNDKCPEVDGSRCPTGCVATAMAQIMYYYQWPKQTTEVIPGYTTSTHGISMPEKPISTIDWNNIRGEYWDNYSNEEANAVSTFMQLYGTAVKMNYTPKGSGAASSEAAKALRKYFNYDDLLEVLSRGGNAEKWENMIYDELMVRRPVYYSGFSEEDGGVGHAFVMDGYEEGYFHVNWGWGGAYSYVLMTDIGGYNYNQTAIVGIQPVNPNSPSRYAVLNNGKMTLYYDREKEHRLGTVIPHKDDWVNYANDITACVIDPSFANLRQRSLGYYFYSLNQLKTIEGMENLRTDDVMDMSGMFSGCSSLTSLDVSSFKMDNVWHMGYMFSDCSSLTSLDVSGFKTDNVTRMSGMFSGCSSLTSLDVSGFKTDNVRDMTDMFQICSSLTSLDLSGFKTDNVWSMGGMFSRCTSLISLDLSSFKTDNVTDMDGMFYYCRNLKKIYVDSGWSTVNVTWGDDMFGECSKLVGGAGTGYSSSHRDFTYAHIDEGPTNPGYFRDKNLPDLDSYALLSEDNTILTFYYDDQMDSRCGMDVNWQQWNSHSGDIITVVFDESFANCTTLTSTSSWFKGCSKLENILGIENLRTDNVTNMYWMFSGCTSLKSLDVSGFKTDNVWNMGNMFNGCSSLTSLDVSNFKTDNVTDVSGMFNGCSSLTSLDLSGFKTDNVTSMGSMFKGCSSLTNLDVSGFKTDNVTNMGDMFKSCSSLTSLDVSVFKTDNVTNMGGMFYGCSSLTNLDVSGFKTDNVWGMDNMFNGCSSLTNLDVSGFKTDNVDRMNHIFYECSSLTSLDVSGFKTDKVWNMASMFCSCSNLTCLDVSSFNTDNVRNMSDMFGGCSTLTSLDVSNFKTDNVTNMSGMFGGCSSLICLDLSGFNTENVTNMRYMFSGCTSLTSLNLSGFKTDNVTYMSEMFLSCSSLTSLDLSGFKTDNVTYMSEMFLSCSSLTSLDLSSFNTDNVTDMSWMFYGCSSLTNLDVSGFKTDNVDRMNVMFCECSSLTSLDLSSFNTDKVTNMIDMFSFCQNLKTIYVREGWNAANVEKSNNMFYACLKLVGGEGTIYDSNHTSADYAHIDGGVTNPGYLTFKDTHKTITYMVDGVEYKSYRLEIGEKITPEPKPTKEGYVFLGWDDIPATMPDHDVVVTGAFYPYGDVNTDKDVDVLDVVDIARYVVEIPSESFVKQLADINKDGNVNLGDAVTLVNEIAGEQNFVRAKASPKDNYINDVLSLTEWNGSLSLNLQNERCYTAFQFDLYVPEGSDVTQMSLNTKRKQGHQLLYNKVEEGHYRVAALSTSNNKFNDNEGELLNIVMNGVSYDEVSVRDIHFFDVKGIDYLFDDIYGSTVTSVRQIDNGKLIMDNSIYDLQGRKRSTLQRGVNIVGGNKVIVK